MTRTIRRLQLSSLSSPWPQLLSIKQTTLKSQLNARPPLFTVPSRLSSCTDSLHGAPARWESRKSAVCSFPGNHLLLKAATHVGLSSHSANRAQSWAQARFQVQDLENLVKRHVAHIALSTVALVSSYAPC